MNMSRDFIPVDSILRKNHSWERANEWSTHFGAASPSLVLPSNAQGSRLFLHDLGFLEHIIRYPSKPFYFQRKLLPRCPRKNL